MTQHTISQPHLRPPDAFHDDSTSSNGFDTPASSSQPSSPPTSSQPGSANASTGKQPERRVLFAAPDQDGAQEGTDFEAWDTGGWDSDDDDDSDMPSDLRPSLDRHHTDGKSHAPLLGKNEHASYEGERPTLSRRSTFHERDPEIEASRATRTKYMYAGFFLVLSLISFAVQTETAVYIQHTLKWEKPYCMLYFTHGSWSLLWPAQLLILRLQKWSMPWQTFWRRHVQILRQTAQMVEHQTLHPPVRARNPIPYMIRTTAVVTCALTVAGGSWYVAVNMTTASDLTAIYNCSAFFAYAFSIPLLKERLRWSKVSAVAVAIVGVLVVAYGDAAPGKHGSKSGGGAGGPSAPPNHEASSRALGNIVIGIGSVLYGFYEVLYKKIACPPEGCSPGRGMIFANTFGSCIGAFTLLVLWVPIPILHILGWETFELPHGEAAWMMLISVLANATFSGSFLVLISLTSPVLSSVAALLTIFIVAIIDQLLPPPLNTPLTPAAIVGGILIIAAFLVLSFATYREMDEERRKKLAEDSEDEDEDDL